MSRLLSIYFKLPVFFQNLFLSAQGYLIQRRRYGRNFSQELEKFEKSKHYEVNTGLLKEFLTTAKKSPYWNNKFKLYDVNLEAADLIQEIKKLPILTKAEVKKHTNDIKIDLAGEKISIVKTSGTTGSGLVFYQTQLMENKQWAVWWRYRMRFGIGLNMWMGWFGGRTIMDVKHKKPPYWRINYPGKQVMFSAHHLSKSTVKYYHAEILKRKLEWLHGYPSQIAYLASLIKEGGLAKLNLKYITLGAENLLSHQIEIIKEVFGVTPCQHYGLAEGVANISQMPDGSLQPDFDFALMEFIPSSKAKNIYRIIGTNYSNFSFPLIRYDTNDLVRIENNELVSIDGRNEDFITLPSGIKLGRLDHIFKEATYVDEAQIYQKSVSDIVLRLVPSITYQKEVHEDELRKACEERFGKEVKISFEYLDQIPRTSAGKLKFVISNL